MSTNVLLFHSPDCQEGHMEKTFVCACACSLFRREDSCKHKLSACLHVRPSLMGRTNKPSYAPAFAENFIRVWSGARNSNLMSVLLTEIWREGPWGNWASAEYWGTEWKKNLWSDITIVFSMVENSKIHILARLQWGWGWGGCETSYQNSFRPCLSPPPPWKSRFSSKKRNFR